MTGSWALKAIEAAAMRRAMAIAAEAPVSVYGLSLAQIAWLRNDYEARTGKDAAATVPDAARDKARAPQPEYDPHGITYI